MVNGMIQLGQITIVYPDSRDLESLAGTLARKMKHYSVSRSIARRTGNRSLKKETHPWLIVLCTPDTPKDPEVNRMIDDFISRGLFGHILTLLVDGLPENSFPESLLHERMEDGTVVDREPLAANVSGLSGARRTRKLKTEKLRLLAPILGVSYDELLNRRARRQKRIIGAIGSAVLLLGAAFLLILLQRARTFQEQADELNKQYRRAEAALNDAEEAANETARSVAATLGVGARDVLLGGDIELSMLFCLSLLPEYSDIPELTDTLEEALRIRSAAGYVPLTVINEDASDQSTDAVPDTSADDAAAGTLQTKQELIWKTNRATEDIQIFDKKTGEMITAIPFVYGADWNQAFSSEGYLAYVYGESEVRVYDPIKGQIIRSFDAYTYPLYSRDIAFAGKVDESMGLPGAEFIKCGNLLYKYQEKEIPVPADLEGQIALAHEFLGGRTLTEAELSYYEIDPEFVLHKTQ